MTKLVLDSGGVTFLARQSRETAARLRSFHRDGLWPAHVPSVVLVECLRGHSGRDAATNQLLKICDIIDHVPEAVARRAAQLRRLARAGSAVDALVVAMAEPDGVALTSDPDDLEALAAHAIGVNVLGV